MLTRKLDQAKDAFQHRDPDASRAAQDHGTSEDHRDGGGRYLKSSIYGGLDGIITTFEVVAGVAGASLSAGIVLILGSANLIADGLGMAFGEFLSGKRSGNFMPPKERGELGNSKIIRKEKKESWWNFTSQKVLPQEDAERVVEVFAKKKDVIVDVMMVEELGLFEADDSPLGNAVATFLSFITLAFSP